MLSLGIPILLFLLGLAASWRSLKQLKTTRKPNNVLAKAPTKLTPRKLPPSPPRVPVLGHLHLVGSLPHRSFQRLAKKYGPLMHLKLGSMDVIVISSPQMAELVLRAHDSVSAKRPMSVVSSDLSFGSKGIIFTPFGPQWRNARKLCVMELLSNAKVKSFAWLRKEEVGKLVDSIKNESEGNKTVDVGFKVATVLEDLIYRMLYGTPKEEDFALKAVVLEALRLAGTLNVGDFLTFLAPLDVQGLRRRIKKLMVAVDDKLESLISDHEDETQNHKRSHKDLVDVMLSLMNNNNPSSEMTNGNNVQKPQYSIERDNIKAILIDLIVPAIDSATNLVKWSLASLLKQPEKMRKLREEIDGVVGIDRVVEEGDVHHFHYLDLVVKEIFRLYPVIFAPHEAMEEITVDGFYFPKGSQIFLNAWAIGRDPTVWSEDCEEFRPERFLGNDIDIVSGQDFRLAPFGFGRRRCPGTQLGLLNVKLLLSQLVHCFDWEMPEGKSPDDLVMREKFGLVMSMRNNLVLVPKYRLNVVV